MFQYLPKPLIDRLSELAISSHLLVCCDYDGTLTTLASHPNLVQLNNEASQVLYDLANLSRTRVAIISGRARDDLKSNSKLNGPILLIGSHGAEILYSATSSQQQNQLGKLLEIKLELKAICATIHGAWIEQKPFSLVIHVREASAAEATWLLDWVRVHFKKTNNIKLIEGKATLELSLSPWTKGDAIRWLIDDWNTKPNTLFMGDDITDETGFAVLTENDLGIKVGDGITGAHYKIPSEAHTLAVLSFLLQTRQLFLRSFKRNL